MWFMPESPTSQQVMLQWRPSLSFMPPSGRFWNCFANKHMCMCVCVWVFPKLCCLLSNFPWKCNILFEKKPIFFAINTCLGDCVFFGVLKFSLLVLFFNKAFPSNNNNRNGDLANNHEQRISFVLINFCETLQIFMDNHFHMFSIFSRRFSVESGHGMEGKKRGIPNSKCSQCKEKCLF